MKFTTTIRLISHGTIFTGSNTKPSAIVVTKHMVFKLCFESGLWLKLVQVAKGFNTNIN